MHSNSTNEPIETKAAKRAVLNNIKWLQSRMDSLDLSCPISQKMHGFYASKKASQELVFDWLSQGGNTAVKLRKAG